MERGGGVHLCVVFQTGLPNTSTGELDSDGFHRERQALKDKALETNRELHQHFHSLKEKVRGGLRGSAMASRLQTHPPPLFTQSSKHIPISSK